MRRVAVVGCSGSGKTTLGRALAGSLGVPFVELDGINHQPGWQPLPRDDFRARVGDVVAGDGWVIDGNYSAVQDLVLARADTVVWLDLPRSLVLRRLVRRTLRRGLLRERLWNGNRESLANLLRLDPEVNVVRWAWRTHGTFEERYAAVAGVRLRSPAEVEKFLAGVL